MPTTQSLVRTSFLLAAAAFLAVASPELSAETLSFDGIQVSNAATKVIFATDYASYLGDSSTFTAANAGGRLFWRGAAGDGQYMHFDLTSLAGQQIVGPGYLTLQNADTIFGAIVAGSSVGLANSAWTATAGVAHPTSTTVASAVSAAGSYANGASLSWGIGGSVLQGLANSPSTNLGLSVIGGSGSTLHFGNGMNPYLTLRTGTLSTANVAAVITVAGGGIWNASNYSFTAGNAYSNRATLTINGLLTTAGAGTAGDIVINGGQVVVNQSGNVTNTYWAVSSTRINQGGLLTINGDSNILDLTLAGGELGASGTGGVYGSWAIRGILVATGATTSTVSASKLYLNFLTAVQVDAGSVLNFTGNIFTGAVTKTGNGNLTLSVANSYSGGTVINAGNVTLGNANAIGTAGVTVNTGGTLTLGAFALGNSVTLAGGTVAGTGTIGGVSATDGTLAVGIVGSGALSKTGSGVLELQGNGGASGAFTGNMTLSAGTIKFTGTGSLGLISSTVANYTGAIANQGVLEFAGTATQSLNGVISGAGSLGTTGTGALTLGAANTFTGNTIVTAGSLRLNNVNAIQFSTLVTNSTSGSVLFGVAGGTYNVGAISGNGTIALSDTAATPGAITLITGNANVAESFSGVLSGSGILQKSGTGTLTLTGVNSYTGQTIISSGTLALSGTGTLGSGIVQLDGGVLDRSASGVNFGSSINLNGGTLTGGSMVVARVSSAQSGTVFTALTGTGGLTKTGTQTLVLGAGSTHTYTGATFVSAGKLQVNGTIASSSVTVSNGASLGGHGTISGAVSLAAGSAINAGGSVGNLTVGSLTIAAGTQVGWDVYDTNGGAGVGYDTFTVTSALNLSGLSSVNKASLVLISLANPQDNISGNAGLFDQSQGHTFTLFSYGSLNLGSNTGITSLFTIDKSSLRDGAGSAVAGNFSLQDTGSAINLVYAAPIPEPSTYGLGLGFLSLAVVAVRRQRRKASA